MAAGEARRRLDEADDLGPRTANTGQPLQPVLPPWPPPKPPAPSAPNTCASSAAFSPTAVEAGALATINGTSGIMLQVYATSPLVVLRKSLTTLTVQGYDPAFLLVNPVDWEACELALSTTNSIEHQGLPYDASARRLFGVPVVVSNAQAAGVSQAVGQGAIGLDVDGRGVQIDWSENATADSFARNEVVARCEGRHACSVFRPGAIVKGELTA